MPDQLFSLTLAEFFDMVNARIRYNAVKMDIEYEKDAWTTSLIMSSSGNYGKKGVAPEKLFKRQLDGIGNKISDKTDSEFKVIDRQEKEDKLNKLLSKFNK